MHPQHMLVVANRTCPCPELIEKVSERALKSEDHRVFVLAPALNSRLRHYVFAVTTLRTSSLGTRSPMASMT